MQITFLTVTSVTYEIIGISVGLTDKISMTVTGVGYSTNAILPADTVHLLKELFIALHLPPIPDEIRMIFQGRVLEDDDASLSFYGIEDQSCVQVVIFPIPTFKSIVEQKMVARY